MKEINHVAELSRTLEYKGSVLDFYTMDVRLPDGKEEAWDLVHQRKRTACVLPIMTDGRMILVRQYRPSIGRWTLEVPGGACDPSDPDTSVTASRELEEETGYHCGKIEPLICLKSAVAFCDEAIDVYDASELEPAGGQHLDEAERISVKLYQPGEVLEEIYAGRIQDAKTVAAVCAYCLKKGIIPGTLQNNVDRDSN